MNFLTLLLPTGGTPSTGPGSKTGTAQQGAAGFEQMLLGLLGVVPQAAGGEGQATTAQIGAAANTATAGAAAALLNGSQAAAATAAQAATPQMGLVEAAAKAATDGLAAAQTTNGEAGKATANATGAISEALLKTVAPGAQPQQTAPQTATTAATTAAQATANAAQTVEQTTQRLAATVDGAAKTATTTVQQAIGNAVNAAAAALKTAEAAVQKAATAAEAASQAAVKASGIPAAAANAVATDAANKAAGTPATPANAAATGAQAASAAAATGVAATTVKPASVTIHKAGDTATKAEATPASLISGSPEVATAKTTIKSAVIQAPGADAGKQDATSGKEKDANSNAALLRANRTAAPLAGETVAQQAQAAAAKAAQHPAAANAANAAKPAESFVHHLSNTAAGTGDASAILGSGSPGTPLHADAASAAQAAARHGAPTFVPPAQQVALQFSRALASGSDHITIHLEPKSLGKVDVQVELTKDGRLTALFVADRADTLDMLQRDARALERSLNDAGLRADSGGLSFSLRGDGGGDLPQFGGQSNGSGRFGLDGKTGDDGDVAPAARQAALNADALLDIRV